MTSRWIPACFLFFLLPGGIHSQGAANESEIARLINRFFDALVQKDLSRATALMDPSSPDFISSRESLRRAFASDRIALSRTALPRTTMNGDEAHSLIATVISALDLKTSRADEIFGDNGWLFDWKRRDGAWTIQRFAPAEQELADQLLKTASPRERASLIAARKDLLTPELPRLLSEAARANSKEDDCKKPLALHEIALEAATALKNPSALAWAYWQEAANCYDMGDYPVALSLYQRATRIFQSAYDPRGQAAGHSETGSVEVSLGHYSEARQEFETGLRFARGVDRDIESTTLRHLGEYYRFTGHLDNAIRYGEDSLRIARELDDRVKIAYSLNNIANVHGARGEFSEALRIYRECLAIHRDLRNPNDEAMSLGNMGVVYEATARAEEAMTMFHEELNLIRPDTDHEGEANALLNIGNVLMETGHYAEALDRYQAAFKVATSAGSKHVQSDALTNMGDLDILRGRFENALESLNQALKTDKGDRAGEAQDYLELAPLHIATGRWNDAIRLLANARRLFASERMSMELITADRYIATVQKARGNYAASETSYLSSLRTAQAVGDRAGEADALTGLADIYLRQGKAQKSAAKSRDAIQIAHQIGRPVLEAASSVISAQALQAQAHTDDAREAYQIALKLATAAAAPEVTVAAHAGLGSLDLAIKDWPEAANECQLAIGEVDRVRSATTDPMLKLGYADRNAEPYRCRLAAFLAMGKNEDALETAESAKARALLDLLEGEKVTDKGLTAAEKQQLEALDLKAVALGDTLRKTPSPEVYELLLRAKREEDDLRRALHSRHTSPEAAQAVAKPISVQSLGALLTDSATALIEYSIGEQSSAVFVIRRPSPGEPPKLSVFPLRVKRSRLIVLAKNFREKLDKQAGDFPEARTLYDLLLAPAEAALSGVATLGIVPDDVLWEVPFAALRDRSGRFLARTQAIFYAPSLTALSAMEQLNRKRQAAAPAASILLVGNPSLGQAGRLTIPLTGTFFSLPGAAREVNAIGDIATRLGVHSTIRTGAGATEAFVKNEWGKFSVVHLAAHAFYDENNSMYSGIVLAQTGDRNEDGILEAREILEQDLSAQLVVLSACNTARGALYAGEGPVGFTWALFVAGAPASLVAQWSVPDTGTSVLMQNFYKTWAFGGATGSAITKARALQAAQQVLLDSHAWSNPHFWAPFVLIGAPD